MGFNKTAPNPSYERYKNILADTPEPEQSKRPGFNKLMGAAFRTENVIGSAMSRERFDAPETYDPAYDPLTEDNLKGYEAFSDKFVDVYSPEQNEAMKLQLDREIADREIIARGGLGGVGAAMFAGTVDPTILIPVGGTIKKGESLLRIGVKSAYAATAGAAVSEAILHSTQETRTAEESALAIGGATVLGGILGPTVVGGYRGLKGKPINGFDPIEYDGIVKRFEDEMTYDPDGDLNASDPEMLARIRADLEATGVYAGDTLDFQAIALEAIVTTLARRQGLNPTEFYETEGPKLFGRKERVSEPRRETYEEMLSRQRRELEENGNRAEETDPDRPTQTRDAYYHRQKLNEIIAYRAKKAKERKAAGQTEHNGYESAEQEAQQNVLEAEVDRLSVIVEDVQNEQLEILKRHKAELEAFKKAEQARQQTPQQPSAPQVDPDKAQQAVKAARAKMNAAIDRGDASGFQSAWNEFVIANRQVPRQARADTAQSLADELKRVTAEFDEASKALASLEGFDERAKMLADLKRTYDDAIGDILRRREALKNRPLKQAATEGYKGADSGEAKEWLRAKAKGLDMSQEARIARARGMRFDTDTVLYHGTDAEFDSFRGLTWLTQNSTQASEVGGKTISVFVRLKNPATLNDFALARREAAREGLSAGAKLDARAAEILSAKGFDSIKDEKFAGVGGRGEEVVAVLDPSNIRSVHAAFDPDLSDSANLLAQQAADIGAARRQLSDDSSSLDLDESAAASINPIYRPEVLPPQRMKGSNREAAQFLEDTYTDEPITDFTAEISPERLDRIATQMAAETQLALAGTGNAFDWYSAALDRTLSVAAVKYPMLTSDAAAQEAGLGTAANARFLFTYIMATTSQNLDVSANAKATYAAFGQMIDRWRAGNYTMDTERWGTGDKKKAMNINFAKFNEMLPKMPGKTVVDQLAAMDEMFRASRTVSEWTAAMKAAGIPYSPPGQTAKDAIVYGSSTLGPKIGNGFWQNLNGNFDPLTIDLWMRRTWGRLTGKSIGLEEALPGQRKRLKAAVKRSRSKQTKTDEYVASLEAELAGVRQQLEALSPKAFATKKTFNAEKKRLKAEEASLTEIVADAKGVKAPEPYRSEYNSDNEALLSYAKRLLKVWDTEYKRLVAKHGKDNVPDDMQPTWARAAKTIKANLGSPLDQVANGTQRQQIEKAGQLALEKLAARGIDVTMADMQALLWYPEKELWTSLTRKLNIDDDGVPIPIASNLNESYDAVFTRILGEQGYDSQAPEQIKGTGRAGTRRDGDQPSTEQLRDTRDRIEGADGEVVRGIGTELQQAGDGSGSGREQAGDGSGRDQGGSLAPLEGAPRNLQGPIAELVAVAEQYARDNGIPLKRQAEYVKVDPERAARIAQAYEDMPHAPNDPAVQEAYANLIRQTRAQYDALIEAGYVFTFFDGASDPYAGKPSAAMRDLRNNKRMAVYGTYDGYGTEGVTAGALADNPMLADTGLQWPDQDGVMRPVVANDLFRAVHDAFGHGLEGASFRARGEENAWQAHVRLFTGSAIKAMTSETRGQNSWVNFGPYAETNRTAKVEDTVFAEQKTGLMSEWTWMEGVAGDVQADALKQQDRGQFNTKTRQLKLFEAADQSTLMHEASHWYLDTLFKIDGNEFVTKQLDEVLNWHGTKRDEVFDGDGNLTSKGVELQEAFAETFESYLQTGKAPIPRLQQVFDRFREWLTALYKALDPRERSNLTPEIKDVFDRMMAFEPGGTERLDLEAMRNPQSVGAAAVAEPTLEDYALAPSLKTADATAALRLNPLIRLATADSAAVREVAAQLLENAMYLGRNLEFKGSPNAVESVMREYEGWHAKAVTAAKKAYRALRKDKNVPNMTKRDFYEQVAYAMRRSDQSDNPHVAAAATAYREAVEKTKQRAIEAGLLPEDVSVKTASSYFHRMWNRNALTRKPNEFKDMTRAWLGDTFRSMQARAAQVEFDLDKLDAKASEADQKLLDQVKELEEIIETEGGLDGYAKTVADDIFETLMGHDARLVDTGFSLVPNARGPLKERTFNIPDLFEAKGAKVEDYLVNDAQEVMSRYMRVMSADIELTRTFGSPDLEAPIEKIKADYRKQIEALPKGSEKEARRLTNQMKNRINDLNGVRDVIRGNYGEDNYDNMFARGAELVRAWNYMTMLGGMTVSALPDVGNKVIANGFFGMFRDMIGPLVTDLKGVKIAATEAKELGIAVEMALATRIASLADVGDMYGRGTQFERFVNGLSNRFTYATGMRHWNDIMKSGDYIAATNRAVRVMERPDRANKQAKAWLANLGIGEDDYKRIMAQVKKHGQKRHTMRLVHADKWDDAEAKRLWIGAMGKNANIQTVTPGAGDKLLVMNGDLGKTLGQFKSFAMAANQRVMIRGAQSARMGDARFVSGLATFVGMGMLVYYLKSQLSGRETSDDPVTWVREGVDRSGILPVFMEVFNTAEKVTGTTIVGDSPSSRYASRGAFASLLGPSVGRGEDVVSFAQGAFDGELKDRDLHAVRKLLPFNNIFYLRKLLDEFEIKATQDLDLEETSLSERRESVFEN